MQNGTEHGCQLGGTCVALGVPVGTLHRLQRFGKINELAGMGRRGRGPRTRARGGGLAGLFGRHAVLQRGHSPSTTCLHTVPTADGQHMGHVGGGKRRDALLTPDSSSRQESSEIITQDLMGSDKLKGLSLGCIATEKRRLTCAAEKSSWHGHRSTSCLPSAAEAFTRASLTAVTL